MENSICAVIVTYNRKEMLCNSLSALLNQTYFFRKVYVIDNASTDGTEIMVQQLMKTNACINYIRLDENVGGAGGFSYGIRKAYEDEENEWIAVLDDDAILPSHYNESIQRLVKQYPDAECCTGNVMYLKDGKWNNTVNDDCEYSKVSKVSFVSPAFKRSLIEKIGFPESDYVIWFDDNEYSKRICKITDIYCLNRVLVKHFQKEQSVDSLCWKKYYGIRNKLCMREKHSNPLCFWSMYFMDRFYFFFSCIIKQLLIEHSLSRFKKRRQLIKDAFKDFREKNMGFNSKYIPTQKILILTEALGGGVYWDIVQIANHMSGKAKVCIGYAQTIELHSAYRDEFDKSVELVKLCNDRRSLGSYLHFLIGMRKLIKEYNPDVVHLHSSVAGVLGRWCFPVHTYKMYYSPHGFAYLNNESKLKTFLYWLAEKISAIRKCTIIACGEKEYELACKFRRDSICVLNGVDVDLGSLFYRDGESHLLRENPFRIVSVGRNCNQKNPQLFLEIAKRLPEYRFFWIGSKLVTELSNVESIEYTDRMTALKNIAGADVFLLTSHFEGLSLSLLEAMALKVPCVVSNCYGNSEVIEHNVSGYVCDELLQYCEAIKKIEMSPKFVEQITGNAYNKVCEKYDVKMMLQKIDFLYEG